MVPKTKIAFGWPLLTNISLLQSTGVEDEYTIECAVPGNGVLSINEQGNYPKNDVVLWGVTAPTNVKQVWKVVSTKNQANRAEDRAGQKGQNKNAPCPRYYVRRIWGVTERHLYALSVTGKDITFQNGLYVHVWNGMSLNRSKPCLFCRSGTAQNCRSGTAHNCQSGTAQNCQSGTILNCHSEFSF